MECVLIHIYSIIGIALLEYIDYNTSHNVLADNQSKHKGRWPGGIPPALSELLRQADQTVQDRGGLQLRTQGSGRCNHHPAIGGESRQLHRQRDWWDRPPIVHYW